MSTRRSFIIALCVIVAGPVIAAEQSAQEFLAAIYAKYKGKDFKGVPFGTDGEINRLFTPSLAKLIDTDAKARQSVTKSVRSAAIRSSMVRIGRSPTSRST